MAQPALSRPRAGLHRRRNYLPNVRAHVPAQVVHGWPNPAGGRNRRPVNCLSRLRAFRQRPRPNQQQRQR
eukprot:9274416-Alexandrium_andersonii.AAC.1